MQTSMTDSPATAPSPTVEERMVRAKMMWRGRYQVSWIHNKKSATRCRGRGQGGYVHEN